MPSIHRTIWNKFHIHPTRQMPLIAWVGTRDDLADLFRELGYGTGAEIGVEVGAYSRTLLLKIPGLKLKCIDPWCAYGRHSQDREDRLHARTVETLKPYADAEIVRRRSMDAVRDVADGSLDFVYIDAMHYYDDVMLDIICWAPKVRRGGIVSGHDYINGHEFGVIPAVESYTRNHGISPYYLTHEAIPSWFWVRD